MKNLSNHIFKAADLLRGSVEISHQKKIVLPLLTLKYLEDSVGKYHIPPEAKWSHILQGSSIKENVIKAIIEIEDKNSDLSGVFMLPKLEEIDEDIFHRLVSVINQVEVTAELIEEILYHFSTNEGKTGGEFITPRSISKLIPILLDIKGGTIYDGAAGVSQLLIEAGKYAKQYGGEYHLYGQELAQDTWSLGKMNLIIQDVNYDLAHGDTLSNPAFVNEGELQKHDYVVMNFPFSLKGWGREKSEYDLYRRFIYGTPSEANADMAFVQQALSSLKEDGKAAVIITHGTLFRGGADRKIREAMINDDVIEAIIGLPQNLFSTTGIPVAILILNKNKSLNRKGLIQFINAEDSFEKMRGQNTLRDEDIEKIRKAYHQMESMKQYSTLVSIKDIKDGNLHFGPYFKVDEVESLFGTVQVNEDEYENSPDKKVELREMVEPFRGLNTPPKKDLEKKEGEYLFIQLADVQDGNILFNQLTPIDIDSKKARTYEVEEGDIIISSRGSAIKIAVVPQYEKKLILSHNFIGLRPRRGVNPFFIKAFLESPLGTYYISSNQKGTSIVVLSVKDIETIPVPNVNRDIQAEIGNAIVRADEELMNMIQQAKEKHRMDYYTLYEKMSITKAFKVASLN